MYFCLMNCRAIDDYVWLPLFETIGLETNVDVFSRWCSLNADLEMISFQIVAIVIVAYRFIMFFVINSQWFIQSSDQLTVIVKGSLSSSLLQHYCDRCFVLGSTWNWHGCIIAHCDVYMWLQEHSDHLRQQLDRCAAHQLLTFLTVFDRICWNLKRRSFYTKLSLPQTCLAAVFCDAIWLRVS